LGWAGRVLLKLGRQSPRPHGMQQIATEKLEAGEDARKADDTKKKKKK
jgi:hypothetical protein